MTNDPFQKFKSSLNKGITNIGVKMSSSLEKSKIQLYINSLEKEIEKIFFSIGEESYALWENESDDSESLHNKFALVKQKKAEIEQLKLELNSIEKHDNKIFGTSGQEVPPEEPSTDKTTCPGCGSQYNTPIKFCRNCGQKLQ